MRTYRIDVGNSSTGPVGFVAYVRARSQGKAVVKLRKGVSFEGYRIVNDRDLTVLVYLSPAQVRLAEVERE